MNDNIIKNIKTMKLLIILRKNRNIINKFKSKNFEKENKFKEDIEKIKNNIKNLNKIILSYQSSIYPNNFGNNNIKKFDFNLVDNHYYIIYKAFLKKDKSVINIIFSNLIQIKYKISKSKKLYNLFIKKENNIIQNNDSILKNLKKYFSKQIKSNNLKNRKIFKSYDIIITKNKQNKEFITNNKNNPKDIIKSIKNNWKVHLSKIVRKLKYPNTKLNFKKNMRKPQIVKKSLIFKTKKIPENFLTKNNIINPLFNSKFTIRKYSNNNNHKKILCNYFNNDDNKKYINSIKSINLKTEENISEKFNKKLKEDFLPNIILIKIKICHIDNTEIVGFQFFYKNQNNDNLVEGIIHGVIINENKYKTNIISFNKESKNDKVIEITCFYNNFLICMQFKTLFENLFVIGNNEEINSKIIVCTINNDTHIYSIESEINERKKLINIDFKTH